jgi:homoprotocatechuate degradation regulator HpaR
MSTKANQIEDGSKGAQSCLRQSMMATGQNESAIEIGSNPAMPEFSYSLPMMLMRGRESVMRFFRPSLRAHDITEQQWRVLRALAFAGDCEVTELARITFLHPPSLTRILRDMQSRKLVQRISGATDRRRSIVSITPQGRELINSVTP